VKADKQAQAGRETVDMTETEDVPAIMVKSHSAVSKMVTKCLDILARKSDNSSTNTNTVQLIADAKVAGKAITIAEIVKRRIIENGGIIHQTTRVQEKPPSIEIPTEGVDRKHLQGEGYEKVKKKVAAQIIIRMEKSVVDKE
jgi:hypothetical protein